MKKLVARLFVLVVLPLSIVWSLNTLFGLELRFDWDSWLAVLILMATLAIFIHPLKKG